MPPQRRAVKYLHFICKRHAVGNDSRVRVTSRCQPPMARRHRTRPWTNPPPSPDLQPAVRPAPGPHRRAGRQVDQPPRPDVRRAGGWRDPHHRPADGEDVLRTAAAMRALGAEVTHDADGTWRVAGRGIGGLTEPADVLDMGNSGTAARLLCGILASHPTVRGDDRRCQPAPPADAPGDRPAVACGARFASREGGRLPLAVEGAARGAAAGLPGAGAVGAGEVGGAALRA